MSSFSTHLFLRMSSWCVSNTHTQEAIAQNSLLTPPYNYESGNALEAMKSVDHVIEGKVFIGGQEHFYLEPNACLAVPAEDGGAEVFATTQRPESIQVD